MHAFAAVLMRGQTNLLPPSRAPGAVRDIARTYPDSYLLCDEPYEDLGIPQCVFGRDEFSALFSTGVAPAHGASPEIPQAHAAAIAFTSGSTGGPLPQVKSWRNLVLTAGLCAERFLGSSRPRVNIVATVPPQHMYGLELSVMLALIGAGVTHAARPFFPGDVRTVLASVPEPRLLVTTPVHLKSLTVSGLEFPALVKIISATAPLSRDAAQRAETALRAPVHEIYGCTEAGSMCTRRTLDGERWHPYPGLRMTHHEGMTHVSGPHLDAPVSTPDVIETNTDGSITLLGRTADMVKVAGKRASLTDLTSKLLGVPGVEDGVVFMPSTERDGVRVAALAVAPGLTEARILDAMARQMDAVFLPRPLRIVDQLPRNALGKLPREELLTLLRAP